ncbi:hypothetical protein WN943_006846 [Citrus x changshan-huyou]
MANIANATSRNVRLNNNMKPGYDLATRLEASGGLTECWNALMELKSCSNEIVICFLNRQADIGPDCCRAIDIITHENCPKLGTLDTGKSNTQDSKELNLETLDLEKSNSQVLEEADSDIRFEERFKDENGLDSDVGGLHIEEEVSGAKWSLDCDSVSEEFDERGVDRHDVAEMVKENEDLRLEESLKRRRSSDDGFEEKKDKKKRVKSVSEDDRKEENILSNSVLSLRDCCKICQS